MSQYMEALAVANAKRTEAADYKRRVTEGEISLADAVATCDLPITVHQLLRSAPRWGVVKTKRAIQMANISSGDLLFGGQNDKRRTRPISRHERMRLVKVVSGTVPTHGKTYRLLDEFQEAEVRKRMVNCGCNVWQIERVCA